MFLTSMREHNTAFYMDDVHSSAYHISSSESPPHVQVEQLARSMGATPAQIAMVSAASPSPSAVPAGMTPKQAAALQAQLAKASTPQEAMKIAQAHGLNPQQASC